MRSIGAYEAKTHLSRLLEEVAQGETITITRNGVPVAVLAPASGAKAFTPQDAIAVIRNSRKHRSLGGVSLRELIDEGRR